MVVLDNHVVAPKGIKKLRFVLMGLGELGRIYRAVSTFITFAIDFNLLLMRQIVVSRSDPTRG